MVAASATGEDPVKVFVGKDWGALSLFDDFLFQQDGIARVPFLDQHSLHWIKPNSLVRFRGMIQDMFGSELYVGAFKDGLNWRTNKFMDVSSCPVPYTDETRLWEHRLYHCVTVPGQNSWASESSNNQKFRDMYNEITLQHGEKRQRDGNPDQMDINVLDHVGASSSKKQKEEGNSTSEELMNCDTSPIIENVSNNVDTSSFSCLVKTYDMLESELKLNDVVEFIGIYTFDPELAVHKNKDDEEMFDLLEDDVLSHLPPSKVPRLHSLIFRKLATQDYLPKSPVSMPLEHMVHGIRETFLEHLTAVLGNDGLAAQFVLLHLLSRDCIYFMDASWKLLQSLGFSKFSVRLAFASTLASMLDGHSSTFMQVAEHRGSAKLCSFITLSSSLGQILMQLHTGILYLIQHETSGELLGSLFKVLVLLICATPYARMPENLLPTLIGQLCTRIREDLVYKMEHSGVLGNALSCLGAALSVSPSSPHVLKMLEDQWSRGILYKKNGK